MPGQFLKILDVAVLTDVGLKRQRNEDSNRYNIPKPDEEGPGALFVVADGMGGLGGGDVASQTAIGEIFARYYAPGNTESNLEKRLQAALESANALVREQAPRLNLMRIGSTAAGLILTQLGDVLAFNVGDCRVYRLRGNKMERISHDQSVMESRIDNGMSPEEAAKTTNTSMVTSFLGQPFPISPEFRGEQAQENDVYLICSDGLWSLTNPDELRKIIQNSSAEEAVHALIKLALKRGGPDNITAMIIRLGKPAAAKRGLLPLIAAIIALIAVVAIGAFLLINNPASTTPATRTPIPSSATPIATATQPVIILPTATNTPTNTVAAPTVTLIPSATDTPKPTSTTVPTNTSAPTDTLAPTVTNTPTLNSTPTDTATAADTATTIPTNTPKPTSTVIPSDTATDTPTNTPLPTDTSTATPTLTPTSGFSPTPSATPIELRYRVTKEVVARICPNETCKSRHSFPAGSYIFVISTVQGGTISGDQSTTWAKVHYIADTVYVPLSSLAATGSTAIPESTDTPTATATVSGSR